MWYLIISIGIAWMLIRFFSDVNKQKVNVKKQGGMRVKYRILINRILSCSSDVKIMQETSVSILIGVSGISGSTGFDITQTFETVTIQYRAKSSVFGNHKLEWRFNSNMDQNLMYEKIHEDMEEHNLKIISKFI